MNKSIGILALLALEFTLVLPADAGRSSSSFRSSSSSSFSSPSRPSSSFGSSSSSSSTSSFGSTNRSGGSGFGSSGSPSRSVTETKPSGSAPVQSTKPTISTPTPQATIQPSLRKESASAAFSTPSPKPTLAPSLGKKSGSNLALPAAVGIGAAMQKSSPVPSTKPTTAPSFGKTYKAVLSTAKLTPKEMPKERVPAGTVVVSNSSNYFTKPNGSSAAAYRYKEPITVGGRNYKPIIVQRPVYLGGRYVPYGTPIFEYYPPTPWYTPWYTPQPVYYFNSSPGNPPLQQTLQPLEEKKEDGNWFTSLISWVLIIGVSGGVTFLIWKYFQSKSPKFTL